MRLLLSAAISTAAVLAAKEPLMTYSKITDAPYMTGDTTQPTDATSCYKGVDLPPVKRPDQPMKGVYLESWNGDKAIDEVAWDVATHLYISFGYYSVRCNLYVSDSVREFVAKVKAEAESRTTPEGKRPVIILAIGGWADTRHFSWCAMNSKRRAKAAKSTAEVIEELGLDGIDLDWEHPRQGGCLGPMEDDEETNHCEGAPTDWMDYCKQPSNWHFHNVADALAYSHLLADLRLALGWKKHISFTVGIGGQLDTAWAGVEDRWNFGNMCEYANFMQYMTYDYFGNWNSPALTSHQASLFCDPQDPQQSLGSYPFRYVDEKNTWCINWPCEWSEIAGQSQQKDMNNLPYCAFPRLHTLGNVEWARAPWEPMAMGASCGETNTSGYNGYFKSICPPERVAIGLAAYGRGFCGVDSTKSGEYEPFTPCDADDTDTPIFANYNQIKAWESDSSYTKYFNKRTQTPFLYNKDKKYWISYVNKEGLENISKYITCRGMAGVFFWAASGDDNGELQRAAFGAVDAQTTTGDYKTCKALVAGGPDEIIDYDRVTTFEDRPKWPSTPYKGEPIGAECCADNSCTTPADDPPDLTLEMESHKQVKRVTPPADPKDDPNPDDLGPAWDPEDETGKKDDEVIANIPDSNCGVQGTCGGNDPGNNGSSTSSTSSSSSSSTESGGGGDDGSSALETFTLPAAALLAPALFALFVF